MCPILACVARGLGATITTPPLQVKPHAAKCPKPPPLCTTPPQRNYDHTSAAAQRSKGRPQVGWKRDQLPMMPCDKIQKIGGKLAGNKLAGNQTRETKLPMMPCDKIQKIGGTTCGPDFDSFDRYMYRKSLPHLSADRFAWPSERQNRGE